MRQARPPIRYEEGYFIPSVPIPDQRAPEEWNIWDHPRSLITIARNPLESSAAWQYDNLINQFPLFSTFFTQISDPDMIRYCFVENADNYRMQPIRQRILKPILREGLVTAEGESWKRARHALTPLFTPKHVTSFAKSMAETTLREMPVLLKDGATVKFSEIMPSFTYLILSDALFSGQISGDREDVLKLVANALKFLGRPDPLDILAAPDWIPRLTKRPGLRAIQKLRDLIQAGYQNRVTMKSRGEILPDDFLTLIMDVADETGAPLSDDEIEDHLLTFIGAGHETTARALTWLFYLLDNDDNARERLEAEVDALNIGLPPDSWGEHLPWTKACLEESMRLYPPAPIVTREAINEDHFADRTIPKGGVAMINLWILHRHNKLWERPNAFNPSRFFGGARKEIGLYQYLPFGLGPRVCIGQRFAVQEALIMIALLARNYRFEYVADEPPWPRMNVTVQPENGMPVRILKRK